MSNIGESLVDHAGFCRKWTSCERAAQWLAVAGVECPSGRDDLPPCSSERGDDAANGFTVIRSAECVDSIDDEQSRRPDPSAKHLLKGRIGLEAVDADQIQSAQDDDLLVCQSRCRKVLSYRRLA